MMEKAKKIYMIGIKGVGMTMLAQYLAAKGKEVSGSDTAEVFMTDKALKSSGIKTVEGFDTGNIPEDADLIVYSTAYNANNNPEVAKVLKGVKKTVTYAEALADVFNRTYGIAVAGSHGKTTTTAWLSYVLHRAGKHPSAMIGAYVPQFGGNCLCGFSDVLVAEADEYQNKLKYFNPQGVILNNIEYDHPDFFPTENEYRAVFADFLKKIPEKGFLVANFDDPAVRNAAEAACRCKIIGYSLQEASDYTAYDLRRTNDRQYFKVKMADDGEEDEPDTKSGELGDFAISLDGRHNIYNALAVIAAAVELGVNLNEIREYLEDFAGTARRMEVMGEYRGALIIDDYGHHPTEIAATIQAVREKYGNRNLIAVFHPHTFTRTKGLFGDFVKSFRQADNLLVLDIYGSAREEHGGVHSLELVRAIKEYNERETINQEVVYTPSLGDCEKHLRENAAKGDIILLIGAGDVFRIGEALLKS